MLTQKMTKQKLTLQNGQAVGRHVVPLLALALRYHEMETSSQDYFYLNQVLAISVAEGHSFLIYFSKKKDHISIFFFQCSKREGEII